MPIKTPENETELAQSSRADVQRVLPEANPFLKNSLLNAIITANAGRVFDFYRNFQKLERNAFPDTADLDEFLERWGSWKDINRLAATSASGVVVVTGVAGSQVPVGSELQSTDGETYETTATATINSNAQTVSSLTSTGLTATVTTGASHNLASGVNVVISGALEPEYNGTFEVTVVSATVLTYELAAPTTSPATGTITMTSTAANVAVVSQDFGAQVNQVAGSNLRFNTVIAGVDTDAFVGINGITGGTDEENLEAFRARLIERYQNPVALFNPAAIITEAKKINGVTRVWVYEITPDVGQVTVYFVRDNDDTIIPDGNEIIDVKNALVAIKPANVSADDVFVLAPTAVTVDFTFTTLSPDTPTMRSAVRANLDAFFREATEVGEAVFEDAFRSAIYTTVDTTNGDRITSFDLSEPVGDVAIAGGEIAVLGSVTFP